MDAVNTLFLIIALLLFISVVASRVSTRFGMPLLLVFLGVGMLAGDEGPGGIGFDSFAGANMIGQMALAVILLDGGLRTRFDSFRLALKPAAVLASWGVVATVGLLGAFATFFLGTDWKMGLLMAAIVGSTDAAAVFSLMRSSGVRLNSRILATLELESGCNDPMAILLVSALIGLIMNPAETGAAQMLTLLAKQLGLGLLFGYLAGKVLARILERISLAEGLYAILIASGGLLVFATTNLLGGSGFLAVYLAGVFIGNSRNSSTEHVLNVMDGLAWLAQASMFLVLGLLVSPARLLENWTNALVIAAFLILVARPLAVWTSLKFFRYNPREVAYISWVGLRGAVPVTLAITPLMAGVPDALKLFDVAFAVVILSLLIQGTTIPFFARLLKVVLPPKPEPLAQREIWLADKLAVSLQSFKVEAGSDAENSHPSAMTRDRFSDGQIFALLRGDQTVAVLPSTQMQAGDVVWFILDEKLGDDFAKQFAAAAGEEQSFFGAFNLNPEAVVGDLAEVYGLPVGEHERGLRLDDLFRERFGDMPVAGDRINLNGFEITVKELDNKARIRLLGLKMPQEGAAAHAA
ncbi:K+/H+ antiporter [Neisseria sp. KEM232]|uniref:potassium/proton antiporter n=1 Tax=unclassified Neisseria TaxID=2623750 RepID=UPI00056B2785|nr:MULTISPECIES: potassium/proton antiporter [unclassified Neisseria]ASP17661.1 K+/H+ antiporter [Neisseria sp. KEM232]